MNTTSKVLTKQQVDSFFHDGYLLIENVFSETDINDALTAVNQILGCDDISQVAEVEPLNSKIPRRIWSPSKQHGYFNAMAEDSKLLDPLEDLLGPNLILQYTKLNIKAPRIGSVVEWHQDLAYYPHTNTDLISCLIYLDDANKNNGCLQVIPKSHKMGILNHYVEGHFRGKVDEKLIATENRVFLEAPAGSVIFLHCLTLHASDMNRSESYRRAFLPAYRAADAYPIYYGPHASHNEPSAKVVRGQKSLTARLENANYILPFAEAEFHSLYQLQEGSHLNKDKHTIAGYYSVAEE